MSEVKVMATKCLHWCKHIYKAAYGWKVRYIKNAVDLHDKEVDEHWKMCPVCGAKKPG